MKSAEESLGISSEEYNDIVNECLYGESNSSDKEEPKFKVGDWVVDGNFVTQITGIEDDGYTNSDQGFISFETAKNFHLWTVKDAKDGDVLSWDDSKCIALFKNIYDKDSFNSYGLVGHCTGIFEPRQSYHDIEGAHPATKEQRDLLFQKMKEAGYEWDAEKKELNKIHVIDEGKDEMDYCFTKMMNGEKVSSTWSEKDEGKLEEAICMIEANGNWVRSEDAVKDISNWLKSLKDRVQPIHEYSDTERQEMFIKSQRPHFWKPTDEQMKALKYVAYHLMPDTNYRKEMFSLYNDLKKLMEGEWGAIPWGEDCVEYTRTDAFIEKAEEWIKENVRGWSYKFIEDFRNYVKG